MLFAARYSLLDIQCKRKKKKKKKKEVTRDPHGTFWLEF